MQREVDFSHSYFYIKKMKRYDAFFREKKRYFFILRACFKTLYIYQCKKGRLHYFKEIFAKKWRQNWYFFNQRYIFLNILKKYSGFLCLYHLFEAS